MLKKTNHEHSKISRTMYLSLLLAFCPTYLLANPFNLKITDSEKLEAYTEIRDQRIKDEPNNPLPYVERGDAHFLLHNFYDAVEDYTSALKLNDLLDEAYFGRGLALAKAGQIAEGIEDFNIYIKRNPNNSRAFTKRGVRYLWLGDIDKAKADFEKALKIDPMNAEAHDDIGVIFAQQKQYSQAADHFMSAFEIDPTYQKAYYNLALISYLTEQDQFALQYVNYALELLPSSRNTLVLKAEILKALGHTEEAQLIMDDADFLPKSNWSERMSIQ